MAVRVAINGFGRIGRMLLRVLLNRSDIEVIAINDLADVETLTHLFKYDSVHGNFKGSITPIKNGLMVNDRNIQFFQEKHPSDLP